MKMNKSITMLIILTLITINIMKVVNFFGVFKFNIAMSDFLLVFTFLLLLLSYFKKDEFKSEIKTFPYLTLSISILGWVLLTSFVAYFSESTISGGLTGILSEFIKTFICILYFYVGFNTLKFIKLSKFNYLWAYSMIAFVTWGILVTIVISKGIVLPDFLMPRYTDYFLGTDTDPNHAATTLFISFFGIGAIYSFDTSKTNFILINLTKFLCILGVFFTTSRGGIISLFVGIIFILIASVLFKEKNTKSIIIILIISILLIFQIDQTLNNGFFLENTIEKIIKISDGYDVRYTLAKAALLMGSDNFVFGVGRGNFKLNAEYYYNLIGGQKFYDIPHNTYFGVFSETGLIGLILYLSILFIIIYKLIMLFKNHKEIFIAFKSFWIWFFAGVIALGLQAAVLNLENRRFIWFLGGVILYLFDYVLIQSYCTKMSQLKNSNQTKKDNYNLNRKRYLFLVLAMLILLVYSILTLSVSLKLERYIGNYEYELSGIEIEENQNIELTFELYFSSNEEDSPRVKASIVEIYDNEESVIDSFDYWACNGLVKRNFYKKHEESRLLLKFEKIDDTLIEYKFKPLSIRTGKTIYRLDEDKILLNLVLHALGKEKALIVVDKQNSITDFDVSQSINFSDKFIVGGVSRTIDNQGLKVISLSVEALIDSTINDKYYVFINAYPDNIHILNSADYEKGYIELKESNREQNTEWRKGTIKTFQFYEPTSDLYKYGIGISNYNNGIFTLLEYENGLNIYRFENQNDNKN